MSYIKKRPAHVALLDAVIAKKPNKYGAKKTACALAYANPRGDHKMHDSAKEARRCDELNLLQRGGEV